MAEAPPQAPEAPEAAAPDSYAELMKLKELLDAGVLTQEEFDAEKAKTLAAGSTSRQIRPSERPLGAPRS